MTALGHDDQFGSLVALPDGVDVPELTARMWDRRDRLDETLPFVVKMVRGGDLPGWFDREIAAEKQRLKPDTKQGRTREITVEAVLVGWLTLKIMGRSSLHSEVARFLLHTISDGSGPPSVSRWSPPTPPARRRTTGRCSTSARWPRGSRG